LSDIPEDPEVFVERYLPSRAAALGDELSGITSIGSVVLRVADAGTWSLRLVDGALEASRGMDDDALLQLTIGETDFVPLVVESLRRAEPARAGSRPRALRALAIDARTARGLRHMPGSVLFVVVDGAAERRVLLTPGVGPAAFERADCTVTCGMEDYRSLQAGNADPMQLFASGRLRLSGNVQLALALSGLLV
jgi:hypothetical protein